GGGPRAPAGRGRAGGGALPGHRRAFRRAPDGGRSPRPGRPRVRGDRGGPGARAGHRPLASPPGAARPQGQAGAVLPVTCADARDTRSALVDDALVPAERAAVETHLATCADCRRELERLRATVALLQGMERPRAPVGFVDRVVAAVRPEPWPRRLGRWLFVPLGVKLPVETAAVAIV